MRAVVDTNVLVFDIFEDAQFHKEAAAGLDSLERWVLPGIVFHELVWFFKGKGIEPARARKKVDEYMTNEKTEFLACTPDDILYASSQMAAYRDYNDLLVLSAAKRTGVSLFSFDAELRKAAVSTSVRLFGSQ